MPPIEHEIRSLGDLIERVTPAERDPASGRWRDTGVYHGAEDASLPLLTSLDRLGGTNPPHTKRELESHILRNFVRYARPYVDARVSGWELLVTAQHHGVPTRLLDWTYSPLVAAFFATRPDPREVDRAIWRLDWQRVHARFELPPLALLIEDLERLVGGESPLTPWRLFEMEPGRREFAAMLEPPSLDARIDAQAATFTITSDTTRSLDAFLDAQGLGDALTKLVIPAACVPRLRDQLDIAGLDERRLFPDLDGVARTLRRYYA